MAESQGPIGVFDSGVGGISVLREINTLLPGEDLLYVADSAYVPYGDKTPEFIRERCFTLSEFLLRQGAKALVVACNTATAAGVPAMRAEYPSIPVIGMEPAVKPAVAASRSGVIGVLATVGTLQSARYAGLLGQFAAGTRVITQSAPGLPEAVERGALDTPETEGLVRSYLRPLLAEKVDVIVLGCTHYPFLRPLIERLVGPEIAIIDTGAAVARQVERRLGEAKLLGNATGRAQFWTTGDPGTLRHVVSRLWGQEIELLAV